MQPFWASNASGLLWFRQPGGATTKALLSNRKFRLFEALQDTGRWHFSQSEFLDIDTTLGYPSRFLSGVVQTVRVMPGV
jgi:hypothetical protein